jgi:ABC-2 type transport system ATP-binding protein
MVDRGTAAAARRTAVTIPREQRMTEQPDDAIVEVVDLVKRYPKRPVNAVDGVSFAVGRGEVFGLLGPNGAGKTTTIGVLTTRVMPTGGVARIQGIDVARDPVAARRLLAVVPQRVNLDRSLSARRNLLFHAAYFGVPPAERERRADELLDQFGLADRGDDKVDRFSGGQSQRLMIARALMHEPTVLFLDEPTTGLDPQARLFVWDRVRDLRERGVTVVLTTHDMDEAEALADRVGIMDNGKLLALDTPAALTALVPGDSMLEIDVAAPDGRALDTVALEAGLADLPGVERVERVMAGAPAFAGAAAGPWGGPPGGPPGGAAWGHGNGAAGAPAGGGARFRLYCTVDAAAMVAPVIGLLAQSGDTLDDLNLGRPSLEDVFINFTGRGLRG